MNKRSPPVWQESLRTGIQVIDEQHQELSRLLERLIDSPKTHITTEDFADRFTRLHNFWFHHFQTEETVMRKMRTDNAEMLMHAHEHEKLSELFVQVNFDCMNKLNLRAEDIYSKIRERIADEMTVVDKTIYANSNRGQ